jgi:hypothetical protein
VIERVRGLCFADALSLAGLGLSAAGAVVTGDGLVAAAQRSPSAATMNWHDRLLLGLWTFRLEHALWFTLGLVVLWVGLGLGGRIGDRTEQVARLVGGVAIGYLLLAGAVLAGSTIVAASGSVGSGVETSFTGRERLATWLLQLATAGAMALVWALAGGRLGERFTVAGAPGDAEPDEQPAAFEEEDDPEPLGAPPLPAPAPPPALQPAAVAALDARAQMGQIPSASEPATPAMRARRLFEERLSFSPRRDDARKLVDQVLAAERAGRLDEATSLADRLAAM